MSRTRVLLLLHTLSLTGAPKVALDAFQEMTDELSVRTVSLEGGPMADRCRKLGALSIINHLPQRDSLPKRALWHLRQQATRRLSVSLRFWQPQVIYANSVAALPMVKRLNLPDVPVVLHVHEMGVELSVRTRDYPELLREWPHQYIAVSDAVRQDLIRTHGIDERKIALIHAFTPMKDAPDEAASSATGLTPSGGSVSGSAPSEPAKRPLVVGGAGLPAWRKGTELWLLMARELVHLMGAENVRFMWVGVYDNYEGCAFREMARKLGIEANVEFVPVTSEPYPHFKKFDVFALTSWEDPCPLVMLENMLLQKPVIYFAGSGGASEAVDETGISIPEFSPRRMAEAVAELAKAPERRGRMGMAARERVIQHFSSTAQVPKIRQLIRGLVQTK